MNKLKNVADKTGTLFTNLVRSVLKIGAVSRSQHPVQCH